MLSTFVANDVRQTLDQFRRSVDQVFENFYGQARPAAVSTSTEQTWTFSPVVESAWDNDVLSLRVILPGVSDKDVRVSVQNNQLILEGERKLPQGFEKNAATQLTYGKFQAALALPGGLDLDHIGCQLQPAEPAGGGPAPGRAAAAALWLRSAGFARA
jgi:HSP20 family protein